MELVSYDEATLEMYKLHCIKKTQLEMVQDRGYDIGDESRFLDMTLEEFIKDVDALRGRANPRSVLTNIYFSKEKYNGKRKIMAVFYSSKLNKNEQSTSLDMARFFEQIASTPLLFMGTREDQGPKASEAVMIIDMKLSSAARDYINHHFRESKIPHQIIKSDDLTFNPTKHVDVPRHELIPKEEALQLCKDLGVLFSRMLIIKTTDPIIRYYGWQSGNMVRIYRNDTSVSLLSTNSISYRSII